MVQWAQGRKGGKLTAILEYRNFGEIKTQISDISQVVFSFIKDTLERDAESYKRRCDANRENGKKGGRPPKKVSASKTQKPKKPDNDNDNDNDNGNDIDNDIVLYILRARVARIRRRASVVVTPNGVTTNREQEKRQNERAGAER